ncbi:uncharacterized protein LOC129938991 isoform X2 [Eupeodes corollae]|nr:uncharacterized protein LOC129938991 isoform X2 [Eupeodes corollae]XP_055902814.1 uncharacterized protein LOC129938991 isoform X2 [Eupeodes corollae]
MEDTVKEENAEAAKYLEHLLEDGAKEEDDGRDLELPPWYDEELFKNGQKYMRKYHFVIFSGMLSGLVAVLAIPSILNVLICTRQSSTPATAFRRYVRTIFHVLSWYDHPVKKGSKFWQSLNMVRKAHLRSSRACGKLKVGGITQKDMALTQFGFIGFITLGAPRIKLYDPDFLESTSHMWRVLGYLLGIKDEYNICGENWEITRQRLEIAMEKVYRPALDNVSTDFYKMTEALLVGLKPVNMMLTPGSFIFFTKRLAYCKGYEYYDEDYPNGVKIPNQKQYFSDLSWWDRFLVSYGLFLVTYLHQYSIIRWYMNFRVWLIQFLMYYFPLGAFFKYGIKWSYVRIFSSSSENEYHED